MTIDGAYALTRRRGRLATVTRLTMNRAVPETGVRSDITEETIVRWAVKQPTAYHRLFRAEATQQRVGDTTFIFWLPDVQASFTKLRQEDYITQDGVRYNVVSSTIEDNAFLVMVSETGA